jgi:hypothetical protein
MSKITISPEVWTMRILRSLLNPVDLEAAEYAERIAALPCTEVDVTSHAFKSRSARMVKMQTVFDAEAAEIQAIELARPRGAEVPRVEPKSIDDPTPPARIRWEPPKKRYVADKPRKPAF